MKKFLSTAYSDSAFNLATLGIRVVFGFILCYFYGLEKIKNFGRLENIFPDPLHITHRISLALVIFASPLRAEGKKCARSWRILPEVGSDPRYPDLSLRDAEAVAFWDQQHAEAVAGA